MKNYNIQKVTLIIPSFNRHKFVKRQIRFWSNFDIRIEDNKKTANLSKKKR